MRYIEKQGTGITDLLETCERNGLQRPLMEGTATRFSITLWRGFKALPQHEGLNEGLNEGLTLLLSLIRENPGKRAKDLAALVGKSLQTVERYIKALKEKGLAEFRGAKRNGGYYSVEGFES